YVPDPIELEDHVPAHIPEHLKDLVPVEDKAPIEAYIPKTREALARSKAYSRTLEARVAVLETQACRHEWQRQTADDFVVQHIMRTQALEAGARIDTLEDTSSSS
nr:hypothetical protein [Tanacetum cinerariifolium]